MSEQNKAIVRRLYEEFWNKKGVDVIDELMTPDALSHPSEQRGTGHFKASLPRLYAAFPDHQFIIEDLIAEGDKVVAHMSGGGVHQGAFLGVAPTGKRVINTGIFIYRIVDGKIVESWSLWDRLGFMEQTGARGSQ